MVCVASGLLLSVLVLIRRGWSPWLPPTLVLAAISPYLAYMDVRWRRLPNCALAMASALAVCALAAAGFSSGNGRPAARALACGAIAVTVSGAAAIASRGLGGGDAKLIGVIALCLGANGWAPPVRAVLCGFVLAAAAVTIRACAAKARRTQRPATIPMGPFLLAGTLTAALTANSA